MSEQIELFVDVYSELNQRALVEADVTVAELVEAISNEFEISPESQAACELFRKSDGTTLLGEKTLLKLDIREGDELVYAWKRRQPLSGGVSAEIQISGFSDVYTIRWQPAIIGRLGKGSDAALIAVNLDWLPTRRRISRQHVQIIEQDGQFFVEHIAEGNSSYLNDNRLSLGKAQPLQHGDHIYLGRNRLELTFLHQQ